MRLRNISRIIIAALLSGLSSFVNADLPLVIEDLITAENKYRVDLGITFANSDRQRVGSRFQILETSGGQFIQIPVQIGNARTNSDMFVPTFGFRYGLNKNIELFTRLSAVVEATRFDGLDQSGSNSSERLSDWVIGANRRFSEDNKTPALLGFVELGLAENIDSEGSDFIYGKNLQLGFTTYRAIDPLVLSLTSGYRYTDKRKINALNIKPGDFFYINPSVSFAVNSVITLTSGMQMSWQGHADVNGQSAGKD